jgi:hypothetical protein
MAEPILQRSSVFRKLLAFQKNAPAIHKNCTASINGRQYKYADLPSVLDAVRPVLSQCGLVLTQSIDGLSLKTAIIDAETGESIDSAFPLEFHGLTWHAIGSAVSYARRYAILSLCGLCADDDDDAASAMQPERNTATNGHTNGHHKPDSLSAWELCETCGDRMRPSKNGGIYCHTCWTTSRTNRNGHAMNGVSQR